MADTSLANYFNIAPSSTTWGIGQNALVQALPLLMQSRGTPNQQFGTALGMSLVSALLGYQARRSAAEQSLQAAEIGSQLIGLQTPQERLALIKGVDSSNVQQNLLGLNARIGEQELQNQLLQRQKIGELTANAEFALGDLGTKLFEREIAKEVARQQAVTGGFAERQQLQDALMRGRLIQRKQLGLEDVNVPTAIFNKAVERNASSDMAFDVAATIDQYKSMPEFVAAKSISAFGDDQLKSRLRNLATVVLQSRSGLAATDKERENLGKILTGDFSAIAPETVSGLLKRFAKDEKELAATSLAAGTQRPEDLITEMRAAAQEGRKSTFTPRVAQYDTSKANDNLPTENRPTSNAMETAARDFLSKLKSKYGAEWATKATTEERQTAMALRQAAGK